VSKVRDKSKLKIRSLLEVLVIERFGPFIAKDIIVASMIHKSWNFT
jgi:hypothetical protein